MDEFKYLGSTIQATDSAQEGDGDKKTTRAKHVKIFTGSDKDGQD